MPAEALIVLAMLAANAVFAAYEMALASVPLARHGAPPAVGAVLRAGDLAMEVRKVRRNRVLEAVIRPAAH